MDVIRIRGARTHNLRNIDLDLPRDRLIVITGLSGSGKSSLAFDTIYAEGQRRYVESLSAYARQFLSVMEKPDVDHIEGLSPAIAIEQKATSHNPRSTVGTVTEIYDYLRVLYARAGVPRCPEHGQDLAAQTVTQMVDQVLALPEGTGVLLLAPVVQDRKGEHAEVFDHLRSQGFVRARIDGRLVELDERPALDGRRRHTIEAVVDRLKVRPDAAQRLAESFETALGLAQGTARLAFHDEPAREPLVFSNRFACTVCGYSLTELEPRLFSFNNPNGACGTCGGLGQQEFFDPARVVVNPEPVARRRRDPRLGPPQCVLLPADPVARAALPLRHRGAMERPARSRAPCAAARQRRGEDPVPLLRCQGRRDPAHARVGRHPAEPRAPLPRDRIDDGARGTRQVSRRARLRGLRRQPAEQAARHVYVAGRALPRIAALSIAEARRFFETLHIDGWRGEIAARLVREVADRLTFLSDVGLDYLSLDRSAETLSGGEAQRIRLASQIGSGLVGVMYILDEPSIGLHQRDNQRLLDTLVRLRDLGNTVLVVEHDEDAIRQADYVVDLGPGAGIHGGQVVAQGTPQDVAGNPDSLTGAYLSGRRRIPCPTVRRTPQPGRVLRVLDASGNNLRQRDGDVSARPDDLRDRRVRLGQVDAGDRHAVPPRGGRPERLGRRRGALPRHRGPRADRPRDRHRPEPDRTHAALEPGDLHRHLRPGARTVCGSARGPRARLRSRAASASTCAAAAARPARATA